MLLMPIMGGAGALTLALTNQDRPLLAVCGLLFLVGAVSVGLLLFVSQRSGPRRKLREGRERYLDYIEQLRHLLRSSIAAQRAGQGWRHPEPAQLVDVARDVTRRWERRLHDDDFLVVRVGTGDEPLWSRPDLNADTGPLNQFDPVCLEAAHELKARYSILHDQPITVDLRGVGTLSVVGPAVLRREAAQAMAMELVAMHAPHEVRVALVRSEHVALEWDWLKWLPHVQDPELDDGGLDARLVTTSVPALLDLLGPDLEERLDRSQRSRGSEHPVPRHLVVFIDGDGLTSQSFLSPERTVALQDLGIHVVTLLDERRQEPELVDDRLDIQDGHTATLASRPGVFRPAHPQAGLGAVIARQLAPLRLEPESEGSDGAMAVTVGLTDILGVDDVTTIDPGQTWRPGHLRDLLKVPIGVGSRGNVVLLDLKESAHGGMGPHGLVVGATGSGKSEMLRTLVASLVVNHGPDRLALMLVDFKGGATFAAMEQIPHIAGAITNLQDDLTLVDRMHDALFGEMQRRQEVLKAAGNLPNVTAYQERIDAGDALEPLPHLLVIVDEFSELLTAKPDFAELFVAIGRIGRSIGVHLLLATQKLEAGKIRGLESHLSYRISLRTFSESESRDAIGVPDAYHLPPEPGAGYLKVDTTVFERFKAALVSSAYRPPAQATGTVVPVIPYLSVNGLGQWIEEQHARQAAPAGSEPPAGGQRQRSTLDVLCERLVSSGAPSVRPVWLEPLPALLPLDAAMDVSATGAAGTVEATLGLVDDPAAQRQFPLTWDFTGAAGNLVVAGAPRTGKSTVVRTLIGSLALRYAPGDVAFYCVDYGGGTLRGLEDLPHVAAVATRVDPERISRTISDVVTLLESREEFFREHDLDSMTAMRRARADGRIPLDVPSDVFLVVDGWGSFREDFDAMEFTIGEVAARGLNYGVHVILTVAQNMQVRMRMQSSFGGHLELRLTDSFDSTIGRKLMDKLPKDVPGRGLVDIGDGLLFHAAVPCVDGGSSGDDLATAQRGLVETVRSRWSTSVQRVQVLPATVSMEDLPEVDRGEDLLPIGLSERNLGPAAVNVFGADPHLLVYGDGETGKTNMLKLLVRQLIASRSVDELAFIVVDYRRSLLDVVPADYLVAYCTGEQQTADTIVQVAGAVRERVPGEDVTSDQLRTRSWWKGVDIVVVVDDYDLVSTPSGNPVQGLLEFLPQGRDLGLHLLVARRTGGLSRAIFEPVLQRLNDIQTPGVVLSGDRMEGRLVNGVVARKLPPGRAIYAARGGGASQVQVALLEDDTATRPA
ncbi:MAG: type VII secretion protein EccCa [Actinomycetota bacterium]|nr:type VII secretion protein EccCa [Actinomycetota bacterium]